MIAYYKQERYKAVARNRRSRLRLNPDVLKKAALAKREVRKTEQYRKWLDGYLKRPDVSQRRQKAIKKYNNSTRGYWNNKHFFHQKRQNIGFRNDCLRCTNPSEFWVKRYES